VCLFTPQLSLALIAPTHGGMAMAQAELKRVANSAPMFTRPKTVKHPGTNWIRRNYIDGDQRVITKSNRH